MSLPHPLFRKPDFPHEARCGTERGGRVSCFWRHQWGKWTDKEALRAKSVKVPDDDGIPVIVQEKRCQRCNAVQLKYVKARETL